MSIRFRLFLSSVAVVLTPALFVALTPRSPRPTCLVTTANGDVQGLDVGASCTFLGIPYAAAPTGALRWKPPQPAAPWASPLPATTQQMGCPNVNTGSPAGSEDCLKMNIWVSNPAPASLVPVIVWLHTGSFVAGSNNLPSHAGLHLAQENGVIVVSPNYRLGPLGFLAHPALAAEDPAHPVSGNYGLLDQRFALQWVRNNIAAFGGDPNNVTLAGTSAGADSVGLHLVSPGSGGLFQRAVIESGTPTIRWPTQTEAFAQGDAFANALGCVDPASILSCLRLRTRDQILTALPVAPQAVREPSGAGVVWLPVVEGLELPDQPRALFGSWRFHQVPTIIGANRDEGAGSFITRSFQSGVTLSQYEAWVATEFGPDAPAVLGEYPAAAYPLPADAMAQVVTDGQFVCEGRRLARTMSDAHPAIYFYSYQYEIDDVFPDRVIHGVESNILFGNSYVPNQFPNHPLNALDLALHAKMAGYWARFAATGNPNVNDETEVHWQKFADPSGAGRGANRYIVLNSTIRTDKRLRERACDFWEPYFLRSMLGKLPAWQ